MGPSRSRPGCPLSGVKRDVTLTFPGRLVTKTDMYLHRADILLGNETKVGGK
jgi:hypothetical protein